MFMIQIWEEEERGKNYCHFITLVKPLLMFWGSYFIVIFISFFYYLHHYNNKAYTILYYVKYLHCIISTTVYCHGCLFNGCIIFQVDSWLTILLGFRIYTVSNSFFFLAFTWNIAMSTGEHKTPYLQLFS